MSTLTDGLVRNNDRAAKTVFEVDKIRQDFPILQSRVHGKPLIYFDNAATTQKPRVVINAMTDYYTNMNSNIHRGVHYLSEQATKAYEDSRFKVKQFLNAADTKEIIFVRGVTEGINLVAQTFGRTQLKEGDEILISNMEHHSNIVPWQILCQEKGANLRIIPINDQGELIVEEFEKLLNKKTKLVSLVHVSNTLGTINPIKKIIDLAHRAGVPVLIDGAQAVAHLKVDVQQMDCDFYTFSGHKLYGPTGIGVLYGKEKYLDQMPPYQGGGDMISSVTFEKTIYNSLPYKFEAGTPNIAGGIGLGAAIDYITRLRIETAATHEKQLLSHATEALSGMKDIKIIGTAKEKASVVSFVLKDIHPHDIGTILDGEGIAIRTGHHCTQPLMQRFGVPATARASFAFYNKIEEIDTFVSALQKVSEVFG